VTSPISAEDVAAGFRSGVHPLDDYFARHALPNDRAGVSRCFVLHGHDGEPRVRGFYTLSMAAVQADAVRNALRARLPRYPLPVALIGRLAVHEGARGRGHGEALLVDALRRILAAGESVGCVGVIVDAKDAAAERFYARYGFVSVEEEVWPRRMFIAMTTVRANAGTPR
jgi:GNAT superfamily N-acetyltransferase